MTLHSSSRFEFTIVDQEFRKEVFFLAKCLGKGFNKFKHLLDSTKNGACVGRGNLLVHCFVEERANDCWELPSIAIPGEKIFARNYYLFKIEGFDSFFIRMLSFIG